MANTTTAVDEVWGWLYQPLQDLKQDHAADPDKPWDVRRAAFLEQLGLTDPAEHPVTHLLIQRLEGLSDEDRHSLLSADDIDTVAYEVVQQCTSEPGEDAGAVDDNAWHAFVATNLALWDGAAESWPQFAEWFVYHGGEQNLGTPAKTFADHVTGMSNEERISTIAQYGVTIATPATPAGTPPAPATAADESTKALIDEILKERPELAAIPEERRLELIAQVLAEPDDDEDED